jgi:DNA-binding response OmpR family regulator
MKVIVADDNETSRLVLETVVSKLGFEVSAHSDGTDVWQAIQKEVEPSLMILDWMMPGLTGVEVCELVRQAEKSQSSYIILLTACDSKEQVVKGLSAGANDYITKPFDKNELLARLQVGRRVIELQSRLAQKIQELETALHEIKTLRGIVTICMHCHKMLNDSKSWERLEQYVEEHSLAQFSHGICPDCLERLYPDPDKKPTKSCVEKQKS